MAANGVSHHIVEDDLAGVAERLSMSQTKVSGKHA